MLTSFGLRVSPPLLGLELCPEGKAEIRFMLSHIDLLLSASSLELYSVKEIGEEADLVGLIYILSQSIVLSKKDVLPVGDVL